MIANVNERENLNEFTLVVCSERKRARKLNRSVTGARKILALTSNVLLLFITGTFQLLLGFLIKFLGLILQTVNHSSYLRVWSRCPNPTIFLRSAIDGTQTK